jgi:hypothetical protein
LKEKYNEDELQFKNMEQGHCISNVLNQFLTGLALEFFFFGKTGDIRMRKNFKNPT